MQQVRLIKRFKDASGPGLQTTSVRPEQVPMYKQWGWELLNPDEAPVLDPKVEQQSIRAGQEIAEQTKPVSASAQPNLAPRPAGKRS